MDRYENIVRYIDYCEKQHGLVVSFKDYIGFITLEPSVAVAFTPYCVHRSVFCNEIKSKPVLFKRCKEICKMLENRCIHAKEPFWGKCYCGVSELVIPIFSHQQVIGSVGISGLETNSAVAAKRIERVAHRYGFSKKHLQSLYDKTLTAKDSGYANAKILGAVLADYLCLYYDYLVACGKAVPHRVYNNATDSLCILPNAVDYIQCNYASDLYLRDVAAFCCCSESYLSHVFKRTLDETFSSYVNRVRVDAAKELLARTSLSITEVAQSCGFADPNYFSSVFRLRVHTSPSGYRKQMQESKNG